MGHAGALLTQEDESATAKMVALESAGATVVDSLLEIRDQVRILLDK
jgi:succinyl-CoA synthetase alpha subunit